MKKVPILTGILAILFSSSPHAQVVVGGDSDAYTCYLIVERGDQGKISSIDICKRAVANIALRKSDRMKTYVNLGILYLRREDYARALSNFKIAIDGAPELAEAYYNRAIAYDAMGNLAAAYADFKEAQRLRPGWDAPTVALERYEVVE